MNKPKLFRSAVVSLLALVFYSGMMAPVSAKELTVQDLAPDNEKLQRGLDFEKSDYLFLISEQPTRTIEELVALSLASRRYSKAFYLRQIVRRSDEAVPVLLARLSDPGFEQLDIEAQMAVLADLGDDSGTGGCRCFYK